MTFSPDADCLPEGISVLNSVVLVKSGPANKICVLAAY